MTAEYLYFYIEHNKSKRMGLISTQQERTTLNYSATNHNMYT